jgi:hypothetical protein
MTQSPPVKNRSSSLPYELLIGWRYTRAGRSAGRNGFISFISGVSMLGIALGVAALIIVLSVMNGFQKEVRDRMLAVVSHIELTTPTGEGFADVNAVLKKVRQHPEVVAAAPFVAQWNNVLLRIFTLLTIVFGISLLYVDVPTHTAYSLPTLEGGEIYNALGFVLFNGYYSVLPWFSFFFAGLLYGRAEIRPRGILPPSSILAILMIVASFFINRFAKKIDTDITVLQRSDLFFLNIRLLFPAFIIYAIGVSLLALNTSIYLFRKVENKRFLRTVQTISSQKYSVIFWHTVIGTITLLATNVQFFSKKIALLIYVALAMTLTLYLTFFWRKHVSEQGPIEWLIKRTSGSSKK